MDIESIKSEQLLRNTIDKLYDQLAEANEVIAFYAQITPGAIMHPADEVVRDAGSKARNYLDKYGAKK